jgi:hypothetical protein
MAHFYLTHSPYCSSTLAPDAVALADYAFASLFAVEGEASVPATTLEAVLAQYNLPGIDWLKVDTQGTDLRLFQSLSPGTRARVLAVDIEPGLMPAYRGEDDFAAAHTALLAAGFWLSNLRADGAVRMRPATLSHASAAGQRLELADIEHAVRRSPYYVEARYLRTLAALAAVSLSQREYVLLWAFALLDDQPAFALDVAAAFEAAFGASELSRKLWAEPIEEIRRPNLRRALAGARRVLYALAPAGLRRTVKSWLR